MDQRDDSDDGTTSAGQPASGVASYIASSEGVAGRLAAALLCPPLPMPPRQYPKLDRSRANSVPIENRELDAHAAAPPLPLAPRDYGRTPPPVAKEPAAAPAAPSIAPIVELILAPLPPAAESPRSVSAPPLEIRPLTPVAPRLEIPFEPLRIEPPAVAFERLELSPKRQSWFALARRVVRFAAFGFAGWMAALCLLIVAYRVVDPPLSSLMLQQRLTGQDITQQWVAIEDVSPDIIRAVLLSEDGRFCQHSGVDFEEMQNAIDRARDGNVRGASTISMQVIKNLFLWPSKSYVRKAIEIPLTYAMEAAWPKQRIMEVYLNIAEWGPGIFGVEAASQHHFDKPASRLNEREAARLAVALPNPVLRDASDPGPRTRRLAADIQGRMRAASTSQTACVVTGRIRRPQPDTDDRPAPDDDWDAVIRRAP